VLARSQLRSLASKLVALLIVPCAALPVGATEPDQSQIERGKYLAAAGDCVSCHTRPDGPAFAGGRALVTPFGTIYSTNITPDEETGIGGWTSDDLRRAMHEGLDPKGRPLFPAFPYTAFTKVSDADVDDIYAYLHSLKPERSAPRKNDLLLRLRWPIMLWNRSFFRPGRFTADPAKSAEWNRGAYLVEGLGHCSACHSPRNFSMAEVAARAYEGGAILDDVAHGKLRRWSAVNLTGAKQGLAAWSLSNLHSYLGTGFSPRAGAFGPMNEVIVNSLAKMTPDDLDAMAVYIKSLPARGDTEKAVIATDAVEAGAAIYKDRCEKCHLASGRGGLFTAPPLAGSAIVQSDDPASLINIILYGPDTPKEISLGQWETMKPYLDILDDAQIASVVNYIRGSWGNYGRQVKAAEVAQQR
jgi:mono/diheme cytochrome c family protein